MAKTDYIRARIEPSLKHEAEAILATIGLNTTDIVTLLYKQVVLNKGLPFSLNIPNEETLEAFAEIDEKQASVKTYTSVDSMMNDLWK